MKLSHALGFIAVSSCLSAGCASTGASQLASAGQARGGNGSQGGALASAVARGIADERVGGMASGNVGRDDFQINAAASFSEHDQQFAGPTPQVPIPHDGRQGQPTDW